MGGEAARLLGVLGWAASALLRRRSRTIALVGGLAFGVALIAAVVMVSDALRVEAERGRLAAPDLVVQRLVAGRPALVDPRSAGPIRALPGVASVTARAWGYVFLPGLRANVAVIGIATIADLRGARLIEGKAPGPGERGSCVLGRELASALGVRVGDKLTLPTLDGRAPALTVTGLFAAETSLYTADVVLVSEDDARALLGLPDGAATDLAIELTNPDESQVVAGAIVDATPGARVIEKRLLERVHALAFGRRSGLVLGASIPALIALLLLAYDRASGLGPGERREIAVLKACGWSTGDVLLAKMLEAVVVATSASIAGVLMAYLWAFPLGAVGLREVLAGWSAMYPSGALVPAVSLGQMLSIVALVTAPYVALSVVPAWRAAGIDPMEALRASLPRGPRARVGPRRRRNDRQRLRQGSAPPARAVRGVERHGVAGRRRRLRRPRP